MIVEEALAALEIVLKQEPLNEIQKIVFCQVWEQKTYLEIAESAGYDDGYVKYVGFQLWKLLSAALGEKITKSNMRSVLEQHILKRRAGILFEKLPTRSQKNCNEAINISVFYEPIGGLVTLKCWLNHKECRLVTLLGIEGIEEIDPPVKLIKQNQKQFDCVIWRTLHKSDSIESLLQEIILRKFSH